MASFLIYIIKWAAVLTLLYSLYGLLLRRETFHGVNRAVLLAILIGSMVLPLCTIETERQTVIAQGVRSTETIISESIATSRTTVDRGLGHGDRLLDPDLGHEPVPALHVMVIWALEGIYLIGLLYFWFRYVLAIVGVGRLIIGGMQFETALPTPRGVKYLSNPKVKVSCSWLRWILVNPADEANDTILAHELAHVRLLHSLDMLLSEMTSCMLWFLPFAWMLRRDLKDIHEYQADQYVIHHGFNRDSYEILLIDRVIKANPRPVVNAFNQSPVKRRLAMMYRRQSSRVAMLRVIYMLPLVAIALTAFARPAAIGSMEHHLLRAEAEAYKIVDRAPAFIPEDEPVVMTSVPAPPFSLKKETEAGGQRHHLYSIDVGTRDLWGDYVEMCRGFNFRRVNGETYMQVFGRIDSDEEKIWLGGPDTYIVNETTGIRYKARRALLPAELNCDIVVRGCKGQEFMFTIVFPDLPSGFWDASIYGVPYCQLRGGTRIINVTQYFDN